MVLMLNRTEFVESVLAANMLGAIAVPLNFRLTPTEIAFLVEDSGARVMITEAVLAPVAIGVRDIEPLLDAVLIAGNAAGNVSGEGTVLFYEDLMNEPGDLPEPIDIPNDSPALIMYTSGTTGRPKGAMLTHANLTGQTMTMLYTSGVDLNNDVGFHRCPVVPHRRDRQPAERDAARPPDGDLSPRRLRPRATARRTGSRESHWHIPGSRAVAGGLRRTDRQSRVICDCG